MNAHPSMLAFRRAEIEARIEQLTALLDLVDGDENLEPYLADTYPVCPIEHVDLEGDDSDREPDGDEQGYGGNEGDHSIGRLEGGSGV
jgi:hypothetical protein